MEIGFYWTLNFESVRYHSHFYRRRNEVWGKVMFLPPATKLRQGNVFTPVCQSFCSQEGMRATHAHSPLGILRDAVNEWAVCILLECMLVTPVCHSVHMGVYTPQADTPSPEMVIEAGGMHPTGMHSCL